MTLSEIKQGIITGNFTSEELSTLFDAVKTARDMLGSKKKRALSLGCEVQFTNSRNGEVLRGNVLKISRKTVTVDTGNFMIWRVPASMLEMI